MQEKIYKLVTNGDEVNWQSILQDLVKTEQMDPWDINVSLLAKRYIDAIRQLKELDFRISGKVLLAAAILLKIKSKRLVGEELMQLDRLIAGGEDEEDLLGEFEDLLESPEDEEKPRLIPRIPQPRKRKVSIYDLVGALEKALEVKQRRVEHSIPPLNVEIPKKTRDITQVIREVYGNIKSFFFKNGQKRLMFSQLVPSERKEDKIFTFIPLLHLDHQRKIDIGQEGHFSDIEITLYDKNKKQEIEQELSKE